MVCSYSYRMAAEFCQPYHHILVGENLDGFGSSHVAIYVSFPPTFYFTLSCFCTGTFTVVWLFCTYISFNETL